MNMMQNNSGIKARPLSEMIGEVAVIAAIQVSALGMTRLDRRASTQADISHGAKSGTGKVSVKRLPGAETAVDAIKAKHTQARAVLNGRTTRWGKDRKLLMNQFIGEVCGEIDEIVRDHDKLRDKFVADAYAYIQNAQYNLGSYDVAPPTVAEIENAFSLSLELSPVPNISAYTTGDSELEKSMRARFEADIQSAYEGAQKDLMKRLAEPLENMVNRMAAYEERQKRQEAEEDVGKTGTFKSTVITNITDLATLVRSFNITGDPVLTDLSNKLDAFEGIDHKALISSADLRADTARRAAEIRASLANWL